MWPVPFTLNINAKYFLIDKHEVSPGFIQAWDEVGTACHKLNIDKLGKKSTGLLPPGTFL